MKLILSLFIFSQIIHADILPVASFYEGVGGFYGAAYSKKDKKNKILLGAVIGDLKGAGVLYTRILSPKLEISIGGGIVKDASIETTYLRGIQDDENNNYIQNLDITAFALGLRYSLIPDFLRIDFSSIKSTVILGEFFDDEVEVDFRDANLFDIETLNNKLSLNFNYRHEAGRYLNYSVGASQLSGRKGQSDHSIIDHRLLINFEVSDLHSFKFITTRSQASAKKTKYDNDTSIRDALGAKCNEITNINEKERCSKLEEAIISNLLSHNTEGSTSVGGANTARSFRELRFKAANTKHFSYEYKFSLSEAFEVFEIDESKEIDLILFYDTAFAADKESDLNDRHAFSRGIGINLSAKNNVIQFQASSGSYDSSAWSLTLGQAF